MNGATTMPSSVIGHSSAVNEGLQIDSSGKIRKEAARLLVQFIYRTGIREGWLQEDQDEDAVLMYLSGEIGDFLAYPAEVSRSHTLFQTLRELDASTIVISKPAVVSTILQKYSTMRYIPCEDGDMIPIISDTTETGVLTKGSGCFLLRDGDLAITYGKATDVISMAQRFNLALASAILYSQEYSTVKSKSEELLSIKPSNSLTFQQSGHWQTKNTLTETEDYIPDQQQLAWLQTLPKNGNSTSPGNEEKDLSFSSNQEEEVKVMDKEEDLAVVLHDSETGETILEEGRRPVYISAILSGLALAINLVIMSLFCRDILTNTLTDKNYLRFSFLVAAIPRFFVSQFFCEHVILTIAQILFPVSQMHRNSLYYSSIRSKPLPAEHVLPHFTIHMPCYKEGLQTVLAPSLNSVRAAVQAYRARGGTANIVISEDGLRLLDQKQAEERIHFYNSLGCSWVARPANGVNGYERRGRFKKASNLNYTYTFSLEVESVLAELESKSDQNDESLYNKALSIALENRKGQTWASGDVRIGDYILLIDSDTRMPVDCLIDAANEMERSPDVAALQHCSGITYVQHHYFERLFGYFVGVFTNFSISWVCANGAMAPLMGHNVFLRWTALQEVQGKIDDQNECSIFSSKHVSEDYELAMRLQMAGYCIRWATYSNQEFREGVSLNPDDEKARWQKYAFGACEIVFNPLYKWFLGPISPLMWKFLFSKKVKSSSKSMAMSYLSSYFAIAVSLPITIAMTVAQGLFWPTLDTTFKPVFDTWIAVIFVFNIAGSIGLVFCRSRSGHKSFWGSAWEGLKHLPAIIIFFSGVAYHVLCAVLAFFGSVNMTWGATSKDYQQTSFGQVLRRFWHCYLVMAILLTAVVVGMSPLVPMTWRLEGLTILFPIFLTIVMHFVFPIFLDPGLLHKFLPRYYAKRLEAPDRHQDFFHAAQERDAELRKEKLIRSVDNFGSSDNSTIGSPSQYGFNPSFSTPSIVGLGSPHYSTNTFSKSFSHSQLANGLKTPPTPFSRASAYDGESPPSVRVPSLPRLPSNPYFPTPSTGHMTPSASFNKSVLAASLHSRTTSR